MENTLVNRIYENIEEDTPSPYSVKAFSPVVIMIIGEVLSILVQKCILDKLAVTRPGVFQRLWLDHYIRQAIKKHGEPYYGAKADIRAALLKTGKTMSEEDIEREIKVFKGANETL